MADLAFIPATLAHAEELALSLRPEDTAEVEANGYTALEGLTRSVEMSSKAWAALVDGKVAGIFGLCPLEPGRACVWLLTGALFLKHHRRFVRIARAIVDELLDEVGDLENFVDARYESAVRWLRWLGFTVLPAEPYGPLGLLFHPFRILRGQQWR